MSRNRKRNGRINASDLFDDDRILGCTQPGPAKFGWDKSTEKTKFPHFSHRLEWKLLRFIPFEAMGFKLSLSKISGKIPDRGLILSGSEIKGSNWGVDHLKN